MKAFRLTLITFFFGLLMPVALSAQTIKPEFFTYPFMQTFSRKDYKASTQNWLVLQDDRGVIYVGNGQGVLEYNRQNWRLIKLDNHSGVRAMTFSGDTTIFVGGHSEIGYLSPDLSGELQYQSLISYIDEEDRDFGVVWFTHSTSEGVYFQSGSHLFRWSGEALKTWGLLSVFLPQI